MDGNMEGGAWSRRSSSHDEVQVQVQRLGNGDGL